MQAFAKKVIRVSLFPEAIPIEVARASNLLGLSSEPKMLQNVWRVERYVEDHYGYEDSDVRVRFPFHEGDKALALFNQWMDESPNAKMECIWR